MASDNDKLNDLKELEKNLKNNSIEEIQNKEVEETPVPSVTEMDGYRVFKRMELPFFGQLYPETWQFAYRCPETDEIAVFSTIDERDQSKIMSEISKLVRKCYLIVDTETGKQISSGNINDPEKLFFFLKLREFYLQDSPITYNALSKVAEEVVEITFMAHNLIYEPINEKLLACFDGRKWSIPTETFGLTEPIVFLHQTIDLSDRIYKYIQIQYEKIQEDDKKTSKDTLDKKFLAMLPFLYETGNEKVESLRQKYKVIIKNEKLYQAYLSLMNRYNFTHQEYILISIDGIEEKQLTKFPGGWKKMFLSDNSNFGGLFD